MAVRYISLLLVTLIWWLALQLTGEYYAHENRTSPYFYNLYTTTNNDTQRRPISTHAPTHAPTHTHISMTCHFYSYDGVVPFPADGLEQDVPKVFIRINIARLSGINPVEQSFCVKFQVEFKMAKSL